MNDIFSEVQEKFDILEVARDLGIRVKRIGSTYRADSIDNSGTGENALCLYTTTNSWYDFMLKIGGDITSLVAHVKFNGDTRQALRYLFPDRENSSFDRALKARKEFMEFIEFGNKNLFDNSRAVSSNALKYLHSRGITDETIKQLKIGVRSANGSIPESRIIFPYWDDAGKNVIYFTSRRFDNFGDGENEQSPKYKKASLQEYPFLHNAPMGLNTLHRKKDDTLVITEGVFDLLAFYQEGYSVLSPNGGDFGKMWKSVLEKVKDFKRVLLAFDSDKAGQDFTYNAARVLLQHRIPFFCVNMLTKDVAEHYEHAHNLDAIINSQTNGLKWLLNYIVPKTPFEELSIGEKDKAMEKCKTFIEEIAPFTKNTDVHQLLIALRSYFPKDWLSSLFEYARKGPSQTDVADTICTNHDIRYNPRAGYYEYQNPKTCAEERGIWKKIDPEVIHGYIRQEYGKFATGSKLSSTLQLIAADPNVLSDAPLREFNSYPLINFTNGTLHIDLDKLELKLMPHRREDYVTVQIPYAYNPDAKCPDWLRFIEEATMSHTDDQAVLQEFAGYTFLPDCRYQKALMLKGGGSNGKSVYFNVISAALGGHGKYGGGYISNTEPAKWSKDFRLMALRESWLNISSDVENDFRGAEGVFKKAVSGEFLEDSYKHKDPISFRPRSKLMVGCNYFPTVNDTSDGFMRRWLIVEFCSHFVEPDKVRPGTNDRIADPNLERKLLQQLPGIMNWMLEGLLKLMRQNHFTHTSRQDALIREFIAVNNPLYSFLEDVEDKLEGSDQGHVIPRSVFFEWYAEWAIKNNVLLLPSNRFYSNMRSVFQNISIPFGEEEQNWIFYSREDMPMSA